ncbi:hypothetical protein ABH920_001796 [Catenulispora sp. EB89]
MNRRSIWMLIPERPAGPVSNDTPATSRSVLVPP